MLPDIQAYSSSHLKNIWLFFTSYEVLHIAQLWWLYLSYAPKALPWCTHTQKMDHNGIVDGTNTAAALNQFAPAVHFLLPVFYTWAVLMSYAPDLWMFVCRCCGVCHSFLSSMAFQLTQMSAMQRPKVASLRQHDTICNPQRCVRMDDVWQTHRAGNHA